MNEKNLMKTSRKHDSLFKELRGTKDQIIGQIKRLIKAGNARRLMIQNKKGKVLFQTQLTAGLTSSALLAFMAPIISMLGMFALMTKKVKVVVEKYPDEQLQKEVEGEVIVDVEEEDEDEV
jgi:hypothetical protein